MENLRRCVFRSYFQSATNMLADQLSYIRACNLIDSFFIAMMKKQIITDTTSDEAFLDARQFINTMVYIEKHAVVSVQIGAYSRMKSGICETCLTSFNILSFDLQEMNFP